MAVLTTNVNDKLKNASRVDNLRLTFQEILRKHFDEQLHVDPQHAGYFFVNSDKFLKERTITTQGFYFGKNFDDPNIQRMLFQELTSHDEAQTLAKQILASSYKIHLMPKPEFFEETIKALGLLLSKPQLAEALYCFKIKADLKDPKDPPQQVLPYIVIYPNLGKPTAELWLQAIIKHFENKTALFGSDITPRFNQKMNALIYYTQGDSDLKNKLVKMKNHELLDKTGIHFAGEAPLQILEDQEKKEVTEEKESLQEFDQEDERLYEESKIKSPKDQPTTLGQKIYSYIPTLLWSKATQFQANSWTRSITEVVDRPSFKVKS